MDFARLGPMALKKINIDQYYLGKDINNPDMFFDSGDLSVNDLILNGKSISETVQETIDSSFENLTIDGKTITETIEETVDESLQELTIGGKTLTEIIQEIVEEQTKIISKNTSISDYTTSIELPVGQSSITYSFQDVGYNTVNDNIPQVISALRIPDQSTTLYQYSINQISMSGFTIILSDEIQEQNTFLELRISQALNPDQVSEVSKVSSGSIQLDPSLMARPDQYIITFNQQYPVGQKISVICSLESADQDPIITCQAVNVSHLNATIQFSDDIPNSNYKLLYIGYPVST